MARQIRCDGRQPDGADDDNRESLARQADFSLPSEPVVRALNQILAWCEKPVAIRLDNGPEHVGSIFQNRS